MVKVITYPHNIDVSLSLTDFLTHAHKCPHSSFISFCEGKGGNSRSSKDDDDKSNKDDDDSDSDRGSNRHERKHADANDDDRYNRRGYK